MKTLFKNLFTLVIIFSATITNYAQTFQDAFLELASERPSKAENMAKIKMAVDEAIASEIAGIKEEMKSLKAKFEEMAKAPAAGKTMMSAETKEKFASDSLQAKQMSVMKELLKNKK